MPRMLEAWSPRLLAAYNPDQPRDELGRFGEGGGESAELPLDYYTKQVEKTVQETRRAATKVAKSIKTKPLTGQEKAAVSAYRGDQVYESANKYLRGQRKTMPKAAKDMVSGMDAAIAKSETKSPLTVYRGLNLKGDVDPKTLFKVGKTFKDDGFVSTSASEKAVDLFMADFDRVGKQTVITMKIDIPKGSNAYGMAPADKDKGEHEEAEVVLGRGSRFQITKITKVAGTRKGENRYVVEGKYLNAKPKKIKASADDGIAAAGRGQRYIWEAGDLVDDDIEASLPPFTPRMLPAWQPRMLQAYSDDQERDESGRWTSGGGTVAKVAEKVSSLFGKVSRALQGDWRSESADRESVGVATKQIEQKSYTHHVTLVRSQLASMGVKDLWSTDLHASPALRREALKSPGTFDRKLDHIEAGLKQARSFADSHEPDGSGHSTAELIDAKLVQITALRDAVEKFRDKQAAKEKPFPPFAGPGPAPPEKPKPPTVADVAKRAETADVATTVKDASQGDLVYPAHYRTKGAAKINVQAAFDHLANGNTVKSAVEHVMASGGLKRSTAQRYVRAAVKEAAAAADRNVIRIKEEVARAKSRRA